MTDHTDASQLAVDSLFLSKLEARTLPCGKDEGAQAAAGSGSALVQVEHQWARPRANIWCVAAPSGERRGAGSGGGVLVQVTWRQARARAHGRSIVSERVYARQHPEGGKERAAAAGSGERRRGTGSGCLFKDFLN